MLFVATHVQRRVFVAIADDAIEEGLQLVPYESVTARFAEDGVTPLKLTQEGNAALLKMLCGTSSLGTANSYSVASSKATTEKTTKHRRGKGKSGNKRKGADDDAHATPELRPRTRTGAKSSSNASINSELQPVEIDSEDEEVEGSVAGSDGACYAPGDILQMDVAALKAMIQGMGGRVTRHDKKAELRMRATHLVAAAGGMPEAAAPEASPAAAAAPVPAAASAAAAAAAAEEASVRTQSNVAHLLEKMQAQHKEQIKQMHTLFASEQEKLRNSLHQQQHAERTGLQQAHAQDLARQQQQISAQLQTQLQSQRQHQDQQRKQEQLDQQKQLRELHQQHTHALKDLLGERAARPPVIAPPLIERDCEQQLHQQQQPHMPHAKPFQPQACQQSGPLPSQAGPHPWGGVPDMMMGSHGTATSAYPLHSPYEPHRAQTQSFNQSFNQTFKENQHPMPPPFYAPQHMPPHLPPTPSPLHPQHQYTQPQVHPHSHLMHMYSVALAEANESGRDARVRANTLAMRLGFM